MNKHTLNVVLAALLFGFVLSAKATPYTFTDLGTLGGIGTISGTRGINNAGQVVGFSTTDEIVTIPSGDGTTIDWAVQHAVLWNNKTAIDLGTLGGVYGNARSINGAGLVVGQTTSPDNSYHAALWNGTTATDLNQPLSGDANAINNSGQIAGYSFIYPGSFDAHATIWTGNTKTDLGTLGGTSSSATGINNAGQVVGSASTTGNTATHATVWNSTIATDLGTLGGTYSQAWAINDAGLIVGSSSNVGDIGYHATLWNGTNITDLGSSIGTGSNARAINNIGQIVGTSFDYSLPGLDSMHATLWENGNIIDLNSFLDADMVLAGWVLNEAHGINDSGWIVGGASNSLLGITSHAFLLSVSPVPEPETYAMFLVGLATLGFMTRRRKNTQVK